MAADLLAENPVYVAPPPPIWSNPLDGFYIGVTGGYGWGSTSADSYRTYPAYVFDNHVSFGRSGGLIGLETGYNWVAFSNWLIGVEGDATAAGIDGKVNACTGTGCSHTESSVAMVSTLRGRIGYTWNNLLLFGTGGAAFVETDNTRTVVSVAAANRQDLVGQSSYSNAGAVGWTAGGGVEYGFSFNLSAKLEYLVAGYNDAHTYSYADSYGNRHASADNQLNLIRAGLAYHFNASYAPLK